MTTPDPRPLPLTRRRLLQGSLAAAGGLAIASSPLLRGGLRAADALAWDPPATGWSAGDYWAVVDAIAERLDGRWRPDVHAYSPVADSYSTATNAHMLTIHAVAAIYGHRGPSRRDDRAVHLVRRLCASPAPWRERTVAAHRRDKMWHVPGWTASLADPNAAQDKAIDPKVAEALAHAWRAADALGLDQGTRDLIADRVSRCARGPFFRYPNVRLNQINWNCDLYALDSELTGSRELLVSDYRQQVLRFVAGATRRPTARASANLGPGYRFVYLPHEPLSHPFNLDSAEYANETLHFIIHHARARAAGMAPLPAPAMATLKAWVERVLLGYWTHAGYLNWDTGLGFKRWHIGKVWALAQQGLMAIALSPEFHRDPRYAAWAKWFFDEGLATYMRLADSEPGRLASPVLFGVDLHGQGMSSRVLFAARMAANAARAVALGLDRVGSAEPPPLYSFDPDIGRLAVTTPTYSTAILARNQHAVPYGGLELARLSDGRQRVAAGIGGRTPASFGFRVRDARGRVLLDSQSGSTTAPRPVPAVRVARIDGGPRRYVSAASSPYPGRPYAGTFRELEARGELRGNGVTIATLHHFSRDWIGVRWRATVGGRRATRWDACFPSWGRGARVVAHLRDGGAVRLDDRGIDVERVAWLHVRSEESGYVVVPRGRLAGLVARIVRPSAQSSAPLGGPTMVIGPPRAAARRSTIFSVRIAVAADEDEAVRLAEALGA